MPVFADYLDLRFAVSDHVGNRNISDVMPRLVQQAESNLNRTLRTQWQVSAFTPAYVDNVAPLPPDFLQLVGTDNSLRVVGANLYCTPHRALPGDVAYYAAIPTLTASTSASNWLLERYPDVYLYAVGVEAAKFLRDVELATASDALLSRSLSSLTIDDERARWSNATVRVGGLTP